MLPVHNSELCLFMRSTSCCLLSHILVVSLCSLICCFTVGHFILHVENTFSGFVFMICFLLEAVMCSKAELYHRSLLPFGSLSLVGNLISPVATIARTVRGGYCLLVFNFESQGTIY